MDYIHRRITINKWNLSDQTEVVDFELFCRDWGVDISSIPYADTISPFYYPTLYGGDTVLVVENKDTCFSLFKLFREKKSNVKGILFGEGRAVVKIFKFLNIYGLGSRDSFLYYGDFDQEGYDYII